MTSRMERHNQNEIIEPDKQTASKNQQPKKQRKKRKTFRKIILSIVSILLIIIGYSIYGYQKGVSEAKNDKDFSPGKLESFNGEKSADGSVNVLLLGSDSRGEDQGRSDTIMVAHFSKNNKKPKIVSFMRDTYVNIPEYGYDKINAAYSYGGAELVRQTLKKNFDVDTEYYASVNFQSFPKIVDTLCPDGVELNAEKTLELDGVNISAGDQKMDGYTLLQYARFRKDEEGDFGRVRRQQQVMNAVFKQSVKASGILRMPEAIGKIRGYTVTDIPTSFYTIMAKTLLTGEGDSVDKLVIPVENSWENGYYDYAGAVLEIDEEMNQQAVQKFLAN